MINKPFRRQQCSNIAKLDRHVKTGVARKVIDINAELPKVRRTTPEQEKAAAPYIYKELHANGFVIDGKGTRRSIFEDLVKEDNTEGFPAGYKPTKAEIYDKKFGGRENWGTVATGKIVELPDPWGDETPDITAWQNQELVIFTRDPDSATAQGEALTFHQIESEARTQCALATIALRSPEA